MTIYKFNWETYDNRDDLETAIRDYAEETYDEMLDDCYGDVEVCGYSYSASEAFSRIDPIAYRCGLSDYEDSLYDDVEEDEVEDKEEE